MFKRRLTSPEGRDLLLLALLGALLTLPLYLNPWLRVRSDALVHIGIVNAIGRSGLPPANPFLAGTGLAYYWGYDALIWLLHRVTGAGIPLLLALLNTLAAATLPPLLYLGARAAGGSRRGGYLAAALGILGLNGLGWLGLPGSGLPRALEGVFPCPA